MATILVIPVVVGDQPQRLAVRRGGTFSFPSSMVPTATDDLLSHKIVDVPHVFFLHHGTCSISSSCGRGAANFVLVAEEVNSQLKEGTSAFPPLQVPFLVADCADPQHASFCEQYSSIVATFPAAILHANEAHAEGRSALHLLPVSYMHSWHILSKLLPRYQTLARTLAQQYSGLTYILLNVLPRRALSDAERGLYRHWLHEIVGSAAGRGPFRPILEELVSTLSYNANSFEYRMALLQEYESFYTTRNETRAAVTSPEGDDPCLSVQTFLQGVAAASNDSTGSLGHSMYQFFWYFATTDASCRSFLRFQERPMVSNKPLEDSALIESWWAEVAPSCHDCWRKSPVVLSEEKEHSTRPWAISVANGGGVSVLLLLVWKLVPERRRQRRLVLVPEAKLE